MSEYPNIQIVGVMLACLGGSQKINLTEGITTEELDLVESELDKVSISVLRRYLSTDDPGCPLGLMQTHKHFSTIWDWGRQG